MKTANTFCWYIQWFYIICIWLLSSAPGTAGVGAGASGFDIIGSDAGAGLGAAFGGGPDALALAVTIPCSSVWMVVIIPVCGSVFVAKLNNKK